MKAKLFKTIGLALATAACIGMTAFAAPSPTASTPVSDTVVSGTDADGQAIDISDIIVTSEIPSEYTDVIENIQTESGFAEVVKSLDLVKLIGVSSAENLTLLDVKDVKVIGNVKFPVTLTFQVKGVTSTTKGTILHYNGSAWEVIDTIMGNGTMTGTFDSLSPVAFVVDKTTLGGAGAAGSGGTSGSTGSTGSSGSSDATSPQTAAGYPATVALLGLSGIAVIAALKKRV